MRFCTAAPDAPLRRSRNDPDFRNAVGDKRKVYGVLVEVGKKLARTIERVDEKEPRTGPRSHAARAGLLRDDRDTGHEPRQSFEQ